MQTRRTGRKSRPTPFSDGTDVQTRRASVIGSTKTRRCAASIRAPRQRAVLKNAPLPRSNPASTQSPHPQDERPSAGCDRGVYRQVARNQESPDRRPLPRSGPRPGVLRCAAPTPRRNTRRSNYLDLRNSIPVEIKEAFDERGIEILFPHRTLYTGAVTDSFSVQHAE